MPRAFLITLKRRVRATGSASTCGGDQRGIAAGCRGVDADVALMLQAGHILGAGEHRQDRPIATGHVVTVSADHIDDPGASGGHYMAWVRLDPNDLAARNITLQAGMPAQVVVSTYPRTMLDYLVAPLSDQVERVFREE